jgi:hypothetical protein
VNLRRRLAALERRLISEPTRLVMPNGTTATIPGHGIYLVKLFESAVSGTSISAEQAAELDLIRRSTGAIEPGGGRIVELIRCFLLGPAKEGA